MTDKERLKKYKELKILETNDVKVCSKCLEIKNLEEFSLSYSGRKGTA